MPYYRLRDDAYVKNWENGIFILGDNDKVLDHTITKKMIGKAKTYTISGGHRLNKEVYERNFKVFQNLYKCNKKNFEILNG